MVGRFTLSRHFVILSHRPLLGLLRYTIATVPFAARHFTQRRLYTVDVIGTWTNLAENQFRHRRRHLFTTHDAVAFARCLVHALVTVPVLKNRTDSIKDSIYEFKTVTSHRPECCPSSAGNSTYDNPCRSHHKAAICPRCHRCDRIGNSAKKTHIINI